MGSPLRHAASLLAFVAGTAGAASLPGPAPLDRIPAGRVEIVALEPARSGVKERELVLSLDGGKSFPVRLTGEIGPADRAARWRVPALPTEHAVLALREGDDGAEEEIVAASAEFVILPSPGAPVEELRLRDGEWTTREADAGQRGLPPPSFGDSGPERWKPLDDAFDALDEPVRALVADPEALPGPAHGRVPALTADGSPPVRRVPSFLPLRE
ncbi:MAG TPA: hypothetical protein PLB02_02795 [Thermoanaerobaculia bacterium]|nr:hypothetical protein [Thermoanaerobaculia bacterium]HQR66300.1 hypothetical protein [Thermoanaerobaculia bacterium]